MKRFSFNTKAYYCNNPSYLVTKSAETAVNMVSSNRNIEFIGDTSKKIHRATKQIPGMKSSKKECQRKINTARGMRDRTLRLPLEIGDKIFNLLPDTVSFDKANKTVEWLLIEAKAAIEELDGDLPQKK